MKLPVPGAKLPKPRGVLSYGYKRSATHTHQGIDLPAPEGTPVYAAAAGTVEHAHRSWQQGFTGYGRVVVVQSADGVHALYAHLHDVHVNKGDRVAKGQALGTVGKTRFSKEGGHVDSFKTSGPHLHFETSATPYPKASEAQRLDPVAWLQQQQGPDQADDDDDTPTNPRGTPTGGLGMLLALLALRWFAHA